MNNRKEEETLAMNLLDKLKIAGGEKISSNALYSFDRDMEKTSDDARSAQDVTTDNP
jgi:ferritin